MVLGPRIVLQKYSFVPRRAARCNRRMASIPAAPSARRIAFAGLLSLAVAMGIGRFSFTPLLPLMLRDGQLDVAWGGWVAAANYAGYLAGALTAARVRLDAVRLGILALVATALLTALMALPSLPLWIVLRFLAGVASAWAFVATSVWCLGALARHGQSARGSAVYAGVGTGIAVAGLYSLAAAARGASAPSLWLQLGGLALVLALPALHTARTLRGMAGPGAPGAPSARAAAAPAAPGGTGGLALCYGLMGFGYILPATFLPVLARSVVDDPRLFGLAWPVFGTMAALSTLTAGWWMRRSSRLSVWTACQFLMGLGALLPSLWLDGFTIALSALLVGGTFMVITLAGVQEIRARAGGDPTAQVGRLTAAFAAGQIAGPVVSSLLLHVPGFAAHGLSIALQVGAAGLFGSSAWLWRQAHPSHPPTHPNHQEVPDVR